MKSLFVPTPQNDSSSKLVNGFGLNLALKVFNNNFSTAFILDRTQPFEFLIYIKLYYKFIIFYNTTRFIFWNIDIRRNFRLDKLLFDQMDYVLRHREMKYCVESRGRGISYIQ